MCLEKMQRIAGDKWAHYKTYYKHFANVSTSQQQTNGHFLLVHFLPGRRKQNYAYCKFAFPEGDAIRSEREALATGLRVANASRSDKTRLK